MKSFIVKNKVVYFILGILFIFLLWTLGNNYFNNDYILPSVSQTFTAFLNLLSKGKTYVILGYTLSRLFISIVACFILGVLLASLSKISSKFKAFIKPLMIMFKTLPVMVVIILLLVMLEEASLYYIVGVVVLPLIYEATINGLDAIDLHIIDEVKMVSNINFTVVKDVYLPLTLPYIITSLLQSVGLGLKVLIMAEFISNTNNSIGYQIILYMNSYKEMSYVYAWGIILVIFIIVIDLLIKHIYEKKILV